MPVQLLPASAAAFAPRATSVNVVLGSKVEPWLTQTLKRINRVKRPLNNVSQHQRCLGETLSSPNAIWGLACLMLPKLPDADMPTEPLQNIFSYHLLHVEAYIVHVDMVLRNEVAFKLTQDTIDALVAHHGDIYCRDARAATPDWPDKELQCKKLHHDYVQAVNKFVFRTHVSALEGLEEEGAGELLCGRAHLVKTSLEALNKPLVAPQTVGQVDFMSTPVSASTSNTVDAWSQLVGALPAVEGWRVLPSSPAVSRTATSSCLDGSVAAPTPDIWTDMNHLQMSSPPPPFTQPHSTAGLFFSAAPAMAPIPTLPLPSMLAPLQCGASVGMCGFGWDRCAEFPTII
ncbi:hypothetical protein CDD81_6193 [Ophiocordyceps australis]|uniref:Uncharacterized protein n=1 Tax=Ophiocordyceps australis TaxID=1399860 RepID=A0A2C5Y8N3_9HYPO|nr:hypothetical protein CDD81_6193 [Ophiocordyceps australis]